MKLILVMLAFLAVHANAVVDATPSAPMRVGIVGLVHGHVEGFLKGGALAPAGGILNRPDVELVGIVEPDQKLFDSYAQGYHLSASLHFHSIQEMVSQAHPRAVLVFTAPNEHRRVIEECAALGVHVMVEKPLTVSYKDALAIQNAAARGKIHVLVNLETSWYTSNTAAIHLLKQGALGPIRKGGLSRRPSGSQVNWSLAGVPIVLDRSQAERRRSAFRFWLLWTESHDLANGWRDSAVRDCCNQAIAAELVSERRR